MDNEVDQVICDLVSDDSKSNQSAAKSVDGDLDAALIDMVAILPEV